MRMAAQLQMKAGLLRLARAARLMREQHPHRARGCAVDRGVRVAAPARIEVAGAVVGHAGDHDLPDAVAQHDVLVLQHRHAESLQFDDPRRSTAVVLVVAGHEEGAVGRFEPGQRRHVRRQVAHAAVDQVAGHRHHVGADPVHGLDDRTHIRPADGRADVDIADLRDREAVQRRRQRIDRHVHRHHGGGAARIREAEQRHQKAKQRDGERAVGRQRGRVEPRRHAGRPGPCHAMREHQQCIAPERQHQQRREQAHAQQAEPHQRQAEPRRALAQPAERERHRQRADDEQPEKARLSRGPRGQCRQQARADIGVQGKRDDGDGQHGRGWLRMRARIAAQGSDPDMRGESARFNHPAQKRPRLAPMALLSSPPLQTCSASAPCRR